MCKKQNNVIEQMLVAAGPSIIPAKDMRRKREKKVNERMTLNQLKQVAGASWGIFSKIKMPPTAHRGESFLK